MFFLILNARLLYFVVNRRPVLDQLLAALQTSAVWQRRHLRRLQRQLL